MALCATRARLRRRAHVRCFFSWLTPSSATPSSSSEQQPQPVHVPVLLDETVSLWVNPMQPKVTKKQRQQQQQQEHAAAVQHAPRFFVDGTAGFGGHSQELLRRHPTATLLCIDRDPEVLAIARANLADFRARVAFHCGSYAALSPQLLRSVHFPDQVDGICVDLGANSFHFDEPRRGFSYMRDGPLDMRYNQQDAACVTAETVLNTYSEQQLTKIFRELGEERLAKEYAKAIVRDRDENGVVFTHTADLRECIERIARKWQAHLPKKMMKKKKNKAQAAVHPATKCFQALRIFVNDELTHVTSGVENLVAQLAPHGRLATIAFHSLEDRPIKRLFRRLDTFTSRAADDEYEAYFDEEYEDEEEDEDGDDDPLVASPDMLKRLGTRRFALVKRKAIKAKPDEIALNPRSRSARLRCLERVL